MFAMPINIYLPDNLPVKCYIIVEGESFNGAGVLFAAVASRGGADGAE